MLEKKKTYIPATNRDSISMPFLLTSGSKIYFSSTPVTPRSLTCSAKKLTKAPYALFFFKGPQLASGCKFLNDHSNIPLVLKVLSPVIFGNNDRFIFWLEYDRALRNSFVCIYFLQLTSRCSQIIYRQQTRVSILLLLSQINEMN